MIFLFPRWDMLVIDCFPPPRKPKKKHGVGESYWEKKAFNRYTLIGLITSCEGLQYNAKLQ